MIAAGPAVAYDHVLDAQIVVAHDRAADVLRGSSHCRRRRPTRRRPRPVGERRSRGAGVAARPRSRAARRPPTMPCAAARRCGRRGRSGSRGRGRRTPSGVGTTPSKPVVDQVPQEPVHARGLRFARVDERCRPPVRLRPGWPRRPREHVPPRRPRSRSVGTTTLVLRDGAAAAGGLGASWLVSRFDRSDAVVGWPAMGPDRRGRPHRPAAWIRRRWPSWPRCSASSPGSSGR